MFNIDWIWRIGRYSASDDRCDSRWGICKPGILYRFNYHPLTHHAVKCRAVIQSEIIDIWELLSIFVYRKYSIIFLTLDKTFHAWTTFISLFTETIIDRYLWHIWMWTILLKFAMPLKTTRPYSLSIMFTNAPERGGDNVGLLSNIYPLQRDIKWLCVVGLIICCDTPLGNSKWYLQYRKFKNKCRSRKPERQEDYITLHQKQSQK